MSNKRMASTLPKIPNVQQKDYQPYNENGFLFHLKLLSDVKYLVFILNLSKFCRLFFETCSKEIIELCLKIS